MPKPEWLIAAPISATNSKADTNLFKYLVRLTRRENLTYEKAADFFLALTDRNANATQIAGAVTALTAKGETPEEIAGMTKAMLRKSVKISSRFDNFINISGTGSSEAKTFNVSTATAFVAAGAGLPVAKHTGRGSKGQTGGAEGLEKLGIRVSIEPKVSQACLNGAGIGFLFSAKFHPESRRLKDISRSLGIRTCLNLLEALANPAGAPHHLIGVWHSSLIEPAAKALSRLKTDRGWIVSGEDGLDEITLNGETLVSEVSGRKIRSFKIAPEEFGLKRADISHLRTESPTESAKIILEVLEGKRRDEARSLIVINAAAALMIGGVEPDAKRAARLAEQSIDSRSALAKMERMIAATNKK
ncbi:MAG: anthranilate phosphoribosyltransferase [Pyrinomonadaceae bacterium]|nr:anthranilate phosphoribosyltransferase [Pyrinomonadaceae bacterium]